MWNTDSKPEKVKNESGFWNKLKRNEATENGLFIFYNFRAPSAREVEQAIEDQDMGIKRKTPLKLNVLWGAKLEIVIWGFITLLIMGTTLWVIKLLLPNSTANLIAGATIVVLIILYLFLSWYSYTIAYALQHHSILITGKMTDVRLAYTRYGLFVHLYYSFVAPDGTELKNKQISIRNDLGFLDPWLYVAYHKVFGNKNNELETVKMRREAFLARPIVVAYVSPRIYKMI
jgi:hypothetical protein